MTNKKITGLASPSISRQRVKEIATLAANAPHLARGLAAIDDKAVRKRIAELGGRARAKDIESLRLAAIKGGKAAKETLGIEFYSMIGERGGSATLQRYSVEFYSTIGKMGVESKMKKKGKKKKDKGNKQS